MVNKEIFSFCNHVLLQWLYYCYKYYLLAAVDIPAVLILYSDPNSLFYLLFLDPDFLSLRNTAAENSCALIHNESATVTFVFFSKLFHFMARGGNSMHHQKLPAPGNSNRYYSTFHCCVFTFSLNNHSISIQPIQPTDPNHS